MHAIGSVHCGGIRMGWCTEQIATKCGLLRCHITTNGQDSGQAEFSENRAGVPCFRGYRQRLHSIRTTAKT
jgi:hypothetical protein